MANSTVLTQLLEMSAKWRASSFARSACDRQEGGGGVCAWALRGRG